MYEKNKNKRRFYEDFKGSKRLYRLIIPHNSAWESTVARRKYALSIHNVVTSQCQRRDVTIGVRII